MIRLLIAGATVRAAVASAQRWGQVAVSAADQFHDLDLQTPTRPWRLSMGYRELPAVLAEWARAPAAEPPIAGHSVDSSVWMYTGALENYPELVAAAPGELWGNAAEVLRRVRDPWQVAAALNKCGIQTPELAESLPPVSAQQRWLRKPRSSAAGRGIRFVGLMDDPLDAATADPAYYYQRWIAGDSGSGVYLAAGGRCRLLGVTRQKLTTAANGHEPFHYAGSIGPLAINAAQQTQWRLVGECLAAEFSLTGLFGVDAMVTDNQVWPVEVNPRYTASVEVLEWAGSWNAIEWQAGACHEGRLPAEPDMSLAGLAGKQIVYATRPAVASADFLRWVAQRNSAQFAADPDHSSSPNASSRRDSQSPPAQHRVAESWSPIADIPQLGTEFRAGEPVVTVRAAVASRSNVALARLSRQLARSADDVLRQLAR